MASEGNDREKNHVTELLQEFNGDGEVQHEVLTCLLSETKDAEKKHATELLQELNGDGEVRARC